MGMIVSVYRNQERGLQGDATLGGVSGRFGRLCVVNVDGPFKPDEETPAVELQVKDHGPNIGKVLRIVPLAYVDRWTMFGGNYAATSDSRFREKCEELLGARFYGAVAIHDRFEG